MTGEPATGTAAGRRGLRHDTVSLLENFAQTLGVLSPAGTISVIIPLLIVSAGNGTWLLLLSTLIIFLIVSVSVVRFASLHSSAGSLATFSRLGWGARGGLIGGWIYLLGISYCIPSAILTAASYLDVLVSLALGPSVSPMRVELLTALLTAACGVSAYRGVRLSTHMMLVIECVSVTLMIILITVGTTRAHAWADPAQLALTGVHFSGLQGGLVLAFMLLAGFEGATSLGEESQDAKRAIPRAILTCMLPLTALYLFMTYCMVSLGNRHVITTQGDGLTVPFDDVAHAIGMPWLGPVSSLGVALSYFACALGSLTVAARVLFSMAREGHFWRSFGETHRVQSTPHRAITLICVFSVALPVGMLAGGVNLGLSISFISQLGSFGLIGGYLMVVIALPCI